MNELFVTFVDYLLTAVTLAILGRVIMSWVSPRGQDPVSQMLIQITEPILDPIRRLLPQTGMFDLAPMIVIIAVNFLIRPLLASVL